MSSKKPSIHLKFVRHAQKNGDDLTEFGKEQARNLNLPDTIAYASDMTRTQLTALLATGSKARIDERLGYSGNKEFYDEAVKATKNGEYCKFVIDSDKYFQNKEDSTYTKVAGDFAEIVLEYCKIRDYAKKRGLLPKISKEFNRLFVSHQGVLELIMFKLIEQNEGREGLEKFIKNNHLEGGVDFCEGIDIYVYEDSIKLKFRNHEFDMDEKFLERLINERNELYINRSKIGKSEVLDWEGKETEPLRKTLTELVTKHQQISQNFMKNKHLEQSLLTSGNIRSHIGTERPVMSLNGAVRNYRKKHENDKDFLGNPDKDFIAYLDSDRDLVGLFDILELDEKRKTLYKQLYEEVGISPIKEVNLPNNNTLYLKCENKNGMGGNHYARYRIIHLALAESLKLLTPGDGKTIVEMTSGSSGCSLAKACKKLGYKLEMFIPDNFPYGRKHPIEENEYFENPEYFDGEDKTCTKIIEVPKYIDGTREALFGKYLQALNSSDCIDIYSPDHASEQFNLILKVFKRIARESIEQIKKGNSGKHIDYSVLARGNGTSTNGMAQEFKKEAESQGKDTHIVAFRGTSKIFGLLSTGMPDVFKNNLEKLIKEGTVDEGITETLDKENVYRIFEKDYPEVREWGDSTLLGLQIIAEMSKKVKGKNFFSVVYDGREKYLSEEELNEWTKSH